MKKKIAIVVGTRPDYMKAVPLIEALSAYPDIETSLIHLGQPYDDVTSKAFFKDLDLPDPWLFLGSGSGPHDENTDETISLLEKNLSRQKPELAVVFGDAHSTMAAAHTAAKLSIPVAHVEAGLRSFDRTMPEEVNRHRTDHISDFLFTTSTYENDNLEKEGILSKKIHLAGNIMIDMLARHLNQALTTSTLEKFGLREDDRIKPYALLTLHLPFNIDNPSALEGILGAMKDVSESIPIIFPIHPRTLARIHEFGFKKYASLMTEENGSSYSPDLGKIYFVPPQGFLNFLALTAHARMFCTDSGTIQAETTYLGIPCLTLRENTEWVVTLKQGTNVLVGVDPENIKSESLKVLATDPPQKGLPNYWDGNAASRIAWVLAASLN